MFYCQTDGVGYVVPNLYFYGVSDPLDALEKSNQYNKTYFNVENFIFQGLVETK